MGVLSKFIPNVVNKGLKIAKIFLEKGFKFWFYNQSSALVIILMLSLFEANSIIEEWGYKWGMIYFGGTWSFKIVLTLLTKVIIIYIRFF